MPEKFDGVVEAVRYKNGQISLVRVYERRGPTFSDLVLLNRKEFLERLEKGKRFMTGQREAFRASTFKVDREVLMLKNENRAVISTRSDVHQDELEGVPVF